MDTWGHRQQEQTPAETKTRLDPGIPEVGTIWYKLKITVVYYIQVE